jgi:hypothetical protein
MQFLFALPFLATGCLVFIVCATVKRWRRFALGFSFWCVALGPCFITGVVLLMLPAKALKLEISSSVGRHLSLTLSCVVAVILASVLAMLHNNIVRLFSETVFRLYATVVSFCVGVLFAFLFVIAESIASIKIPAAVAINTVFALLLGSGLASFTFQHSSSFREVVGGK